MFLLKSKLKRFNIKSIWAEDAKIKKSLFSWGLPFLDGLAQVLYGDHSLTKSCTMNCTYLQRSSSLFDEQNSWLLFKEVPCKAQFNHIPSRKTVKFDSIGWLTPLPTQNNASKFKNVSQILLKATVVFGKDVVYDSNSPFFSGVWLKHHSCRSVNDKQTIWLSNISSPQEDVCTKHCQRHYGPRHWLLWPVILVW